MICCFKKFGFSAEMVTAPGIPTVSNPLGLVCHHASNALSTIEFRIWSKVPLYNGITRDLFPGVSGPQLAVLYVMSSQMLLVVVCLRQVQSPVCVISVPTFSWS